MGTEARESDTEPFGEKMARLSGQLHEQFAESDCLPTVIKANLERLGYGQ